MGKKKGNPFVILNLFQDLIRIAFNYKKCVLLEGSNLLLHLAVGNGSLANLADFNFLGVGFDLIKSLYSSSLAYWALCSSVLWKFSYACSSVCF